MQWYVSRNGQTGGPFTGEQLRQFATIGKLVRTDLVCAEGREWVAAGTFTELFNNAPPGPPPLPVPMQAAVLPVAAAAPAVTTTRGRAKNAIICKVCDRGTLKTKKVYRLSSPVALIGWIVLLPSFVGMLSGAETILKAVELYRTDDAIARAEKKRKEDKLLEEALENAGIPSAIVAKVRDHERPTETELRRLSEVQLEAIQDAIHRYDASDPISNRTLASVKLAGGLTSVIIWFVAGLLGWLLTMKKRVLQCNACQAVVAAS